MTVSETRKDLMLKMSEKILTQQALLEGHEPKFLKLEQEIKQLLHQIGMGNEKIEELKEELTELRLDYHADTDNLLKAQKLEKLNQLLRDGQGELEQEIKKLKEIRDLTWEENQELKKQSYPLTVKELNKYKKIVQNIRKQIKGLFDSDYIYINELRKLVEKP